MRTFLLFGVAGLVCAGCARSQPLGELSAPEKLTLYSIDGGSGEKKEGQAGETFHGYPVLGKVKVADSGERRKVVETLIDAYARQPKHAMACFNPRHGLRAVEHGKVIEHVICFECARIKVYVDGKRIRQELLNPDVQPVFDTLLTDTGVPLAPK